MRKLIKLWLIIILFLSGSTFVLIISAEKEVKHKITIVVEAEMVNTIARPMEIARGEDASEGRYIQIKEAKKLTAFMIEKEETIKKIIKGKGGFFILEYSL